MRSMPCFATVSVALCFVCAQGWAQQASTQKKSKDAAHALGEPQGDGKGFEQHRPFRAGRGGGGVRKRGIGLADVGTAGPSRPRQGMNLGAFVTRDAIGRRRSVRTLWIKTNNAYPLSKIDGVLAKGERGLQKCYETSGRGYQGALRVDFDLDRKGRVHKPQWGYAETVPKSLKTCMERALKKWSFPGHRDRTNLVASVAFEFKIHNVYKAIEPSANGTPEPAGARRRGSVAVPKVIHGRHTVKGSLDRDIVRRVVRRHRNEIRYCYEIGLKRDPKLYGQVQVKFTISGKGSVTSASVSSTTLKDREVEECMIRRVRHWFFPEPKGGGNVIVNYPFEFNS